MASRVKCSGLEKPGTVRPFLCCTVDQVFKLNGYQKVGVRFIYLLHFCLCIWEMNLFFFHILYGHS